MMILSVSVARRGSMCKAESLSSSQDRTNVNDWVIILVREESICKVKTLCARTVKIDVQGRSYRSNNCVLVRTGSILEFESLCSCKSRVYVQGCVTVIVWIEPKVQVESRCSYIAQPAFLAIGIGISPTFGYENCPRPNTYVKNNAVLPTYFLSVKVHALT